MKVLEIYKDYYPPVIGGIEGHVHLLAHGLKARGVDVSVLVSNTSARLVRENIGGIPVTKVPQLGRFASAPINATLPFWINRLGRDADILHFHFPNPTAELSYLVSRINCKVVVTYHSDIVRQAQLAKLYAPFLLKFFIKAHTIIATSPNYIESSTVLKRFRNKCTVIPLGIDTHRFEAGKQDLVRIEQIRKEHGSPLVVFVGRFRYYKGLHVLIDAMKTVRGRLLLIGSGPLESQLRSQVASAGSDRKICFLGELSDEEVAAHLHASDVLTLPAIWRSEAFGIAQLEAMACGVPVVSTELGTGTSFLNQHGETGWVVPPNDSQALAAALNDLLENPERRKTMGQAALARAQGLFSKEIMLDQLVQTLTAAS